MFESLWRFPQEIRVGNEDEYLLESPRESPPVHHVSCHQKRELLWVAWAEQELLEDTPHRQVVFTIPKRLGIFFRYDRKLLGELAACAWRALELYFHISFDGTELTPGAVGFLQTSGELLNFHPHIHILMTDGSFRPDGSFLRLPRFNSRHRQLGCAGIHRPRRRSHPRAFPSRTRAQPLGVTGID
ncbi:MAG: hypothetical protein EP299_05885 [Acidobacteria bacterium]|nr:MAG: hypothetical protein EP299_05885 [Acidobacteriota bacterium]